MPRASLAVDDSLADELSVIARDKKMTLYSLTNVILESAIRLYKEGGDPRVLVDLWRVYQLLKDVDAVIVPSEFMDELIAELYYNNKEKLLKKFYQLGTEVASLLRIYATTIADLINLLPSYLQFFPLKRVSYKYLTNGAYEVTFIGAGGRMETTECLYEVIKAVANSYNAKIDESTISRGIIKIIIRENR